MKDKADILNEKLEQFLIEENFTIGERIYQPNIKFKNAFRQFGMLEAMLSVNILSYDNDIGLIVTLECKVPIGANGCYTFIKCGINSEDLMENYLKYCMNFVDLIRLIYGFEV